MKFQSNIHVLAFLRASVHVAGIIVSGVGLVAMLGWIMDNPSLRSILPGLPAMRFNTALCLLLMGIAVWLLQDEEAGRTRKRGAKALAGLVLAISTLTITEYLFGWNLGIDELFFKDLQSHPDLFPGRMSPIAVLCSGLASTALLLIGSRMSQYLSVGVFVLSIVVIMNFLFGFQDLFRDPQITYSAVQTAGAFLLLSLALLAMRPTRGMMRMLASDLPGSRAMRLLLPGIILLAIVMGWLVEWAEAAGLLDPSTDSILLVIILIFTYSPLVYFISKSINRAEEGILYVNRLYATLSQVNEAIVRVKSQQELFKSICTIAVNFGKFRLAWIGLLDRDSGRVTPVAIHSPIGLNLPFKNINTREMPFKEGLIGVAFTSGRAQFSDDLAVDRRMRHWRETALKDDYHSAAVIPIRQSGQVVGFLNLYAADAGFFMVKEEQSLLEEIGLDISFALDTMVTESERKRAEMQSQRQLERLKGLRAIDMAISSSFDIHEILDIVLQQVVSQLGVDAAAILLFDPRDQTIEYAASRGFRSHAIDHTRLKLSEGYAGRAVRERLTIHIPGLVADGSKLAEAIQLGEEGFVDYYGTPLIAREEMKGVLEIYQRSSHDSNAEWLDSLETLAGQAAIAIDNAQLFENLQHANAQLEQRVATRTEELSQMNIELGRASRAKDEFLATMSHELRTPLNSILGLSESLLEQKRGSLNDQQQKSLEIIESSGRHLLVLINDVLDLSKIEAGMLDFYPQLISVDDLCRSSLTFIKAQAVKKGITISYANETSIPQFSADPRRLKQILVNLLANAVKFTPEQGCVTLQVNADREQNRMQFSVIDTGIGITPEDLRGLFKPFVQLDGSLNRQHEGSGLGLALVQKLTDLHGGSVHVESEEGKGSRFTVNLPLLNNEAAPAEATEPASISLTPALTHEQAKTSSVPSYKAAHDGIILLAEDNMANILTINDYLESHGYRVVIARDGLEAIEKAEEIRPNIILMDIQMPVMDGLEAMGRLRTNTLFAATPIIALTALAMPGDRERCLEAGANEYMSKPVSLKMLLKAIEKFTEPVG